MLQFSWLLYVKVAVCNKKISVVAISTRCFSYRGHHVTMKPAIRQVENFILTTFEWLKLKLG